MTFDRVFNTALCIIRDEALAEDVASDIYLMIWNNRDKLLNITNLQAYINASARNKSLNLLKKQKKQCSIDTYEDAIEVSVEMNSLLSGMYSKESISLINKAINGLPAKMKQVFCLVKLFEYSYQEVGEMLDISKKTVNNHITEALKRLREELNEIL